MSSARRDISLSFAARDISVSFAAHGISLMQGDCRGWRGVPRLPYGLRLRATGWSALWWRNAGQEDGGEGEGADQEWKPHWGKPGHGDEEQDIGFTERVRPSNGGPKGGVVDDVPDGKSPKENGATRSGVRRREQSDGEQHQDGDGLAKDFEGEQAFRELADRLGLHVKLTGHVDNVGESPLVSGQQAGGR